MAKPRIVFLINSLEGGGAERVMSKLLRSALDYTQQYEIEFVMLDKEEQAYNSPPSIPVHQLDCKGSLVASVRQLYSVLNQIRPALVISFLTRANLANILVSKITGHRAIISERTNTSIHHAANGLQGVFSKWLIRWLYPAAARTIAVSRGVAADLAASFNIPAARLEVIQNPFDVHDLEALAAEPAHFPTSRPYIAGIGRLVASKNFFLLIDAFAAAKLPDLDLLVLGHGPLEDELRAYALQSGAGNSIHFAGFLANPFPILKNAQAYVLCSNAEGFPNALVEAMTLGVPVVATDCPSGPAEIFGREPEGSAVGVHETPFGILVPPRDKASMASALSVITKSGQRDAWGERARLGASPYDARVSLGRYWNAIASVLSTQHDVSLAGPPSHKSIASEQG